MTTPKSKIQIAITVAKFLILVGIISWLIATFPKDDWDALVNQPKNWSLLLQAFVVILVAHLVSFWRWQILVQSLHVPLSLIEAVRLGFLGTLLNLVSIGSVGGDVFKAIEAARLAETKRTEVVTSVLVDRAIGLLGLLIVAGTSLLLAPELSEWMKSIRNGAVAFAAMGVTVIGLIVVIGGHIPIRWLNRVPVVGHVVYRVANACMIFKGRPFLVLQLLMSTVAVHSLFTLGCFLISSALYSTAPTLAQHFMAIPPAMAAATLPLTPGGVGLQEMAMSVLFGELVGIPEDFSGLIVAGMFRAMLICVALIGSIVYFTGAGRRDRKSAGQKQVDAP